MTSETETKSADEQGRASQRLSVGLAVLAGLVRLLPNTMNLTPVGALGLFGGARLRGRLAYVLPLAVMAVTDALLAYLKGYPLVHSMTPVVYGCFLVNVLLGRLLSHTRSPVWIGSAALAGSLQFFLLTNFAFFLTGYYGLTWAGLVECYVKALPFYRGTLAGDVLFTGLFFGLHALLVHRLAARRHAEVAS